MQVASNRLADVVAWYRKTLQNQYEAGEARLIVEWVVEEKLGFDKIKASINGDYRLSESELLLVHFAIKRIAAHEPVQYVLGKGWFYGRPFLVRPGVLIPRRETEELAEWALRLAKPGHHVLDIGTGSGCIAITLRIENPELRVTALDKSPEALEVCRINARSHQAEVELLHVDILAPSLAPPAVSYDLIVSNPPYVCEKEKKAMQPNVLNHEPHEALFVPDDDPLLFYRAIGLYARAALRPGGSLLIEINEAYGKETIGMLQNQGYTDVELRQDLQGRDRMIRAING